MAKTVVAIDQAAEVRATETGDQAALFQAVRIAEALLFASSKPLSAQDLQSGMPKDCNVHEVLEQLGLLYAERGVQLVEVAGGWVFRTAEDLSFLLRREAVEQKRLGRAALETLAIIAYHQPVTRADIEDVRGVAISKGTLDTLMEIGWVKMRGRRRTPGRPVTYGVTPAFLEHFGLDTLSDLPGLRELKGAGLLDANLPPDFDMPLARAQEDLLPDEAPLDEEDEREPPLDIDLPDYLQQRPNS